MSEQNNYLKNKCTLCASVLIKENRSEDHVIPNAIGGKKKTSVFICKICNDKFGEECDFILANKFLFFSLACGIKRDRGDSPNLKIKTISGKELLLRHDGSMTSRKPSYEETDGEDGEMKIQISARTKKEAKTMLEGIKRKHPTFSIKDTLEKMTINQSYLEESLLQDIEFGCPLAGRSMVKTALALLAECGVPTDSCSKAINYLKNPEEPPPFGLCYTLDLVINRPNDDIFHCVALKGISSMGKILGYVEYFNIERILIELSDTYKGEDFYCSYSINPITGLKNDIQINFNQDFDQLMGIINNDDYLLDKYVECLNYVMPIVIKKNRELELKRIIEEAREEAKFPYKNSEKEFNEDSEHTYNMNFSSILAEKLKPFFHAHLRLYYPEGRRK